jgi:peptide/nickel transport system substrate-binding protein
MEASRLASSSGFDRRVFLKGSGALFGVAGLVGAGGLLGACGDSASSSSGSGAAPSDTLRFAFLADMQVPDPDIFYEGEGNVVIMAAYEGLIQYAPDSADFAPALAESWEVSPDGLTYTFHLRSGVTFHDGTPMDAESFIKSFERRTKVNQGPAYMLADVTSTEAPDPSTLVITLAHAVHPFLHFLACPWGPKAVSPTAMAAHEEAGDLAQKWFETNSAGTGPYLFKEFVPSSHYTLEAYPGYWGTKPDFTTVRIEIIPDITTQRLKIEKGELDVITKGLPVGDVETLSERDDITVTRRPMAFKTALYVNPQKGLFVDRELRRALRTALDRPALVEPTYKDTAVVSTGFYPVGMVPDGVAPDDPEYDPEPLKRLVADLDSKSVDLAYDEQGGATDRRLTEILQTQLQAIGFDVTVRGIPTAQAFAMYDTPEDQQPDLMVNVAGGDALHPDTQVRIFYRTGAAPLNWFNYASDEVDAEMDAGLASTTDDEAMAHYEKCAELVKDEGWIVNICDVQDVIITRASITNVVHDLAAGHSVRVAGFEKA